MKLRKLLKLLDEHIRVAIVDKGRDITVYEVSKINNQLKERYVEKLYRASSDNVYDFYIKLKIWNYIKLNIIIT